MKKRLLLAISGGLFAVMMLGGVASAHVHGITPLIDISVENANAGGNGTNGTPADDANGGPITGLIPRDTGNSPLTSGDGGRGALTGNPHAP
ncbi:MAG: hypothetical protein O3B95_12270 [Chloroflexi bacterium]|nr:hypothetical protein [Chloroflexota bacterium]